MKRFLFLLAVCFSVPVWAQNIGWLDSRAKNAPAFETRVELVDYLTKDLTSDRDKARVIAVWIASQVQRDGYRHKELIKYSNKNRLAPSALENDPFKTRIGTPQAFAELFQSLGQLADLKIEVITGYAGKDIKAFRYKEPAYQAAEILTDSWGLNDYHLQRYQAAWNAVQIDDKWYLLDTYWMIANEDLYAATDISSERAMQRLLTQREKKTPSKAILTRGKQINNDYFFAKPRFFIKTHFPMDSAWQLLPVPWTWSTFTTQ